MNRRAFTLLEVVLAVAMLSLMTLSIYRFMEANVRAIQISTETGAEKISIGSLVTTLQAQLHDLPLGQPAALSGEPHQFNQKPSDEMTWVCGPGPGLFTAHAAGVYRATFTLRPVENDTRRLELGIRRAALGANETEFSWLPLLSDVAALEIRYFDPRMNAWLEKWTDRRARPALVRVRVWRGEDEEPYEAVLSMPRREVPSR